MALPHDNSTRRSKRRRFSSGLPRSADGGSSSSPLPETGQLVGDTQTPLGRMDATSEKWYVLEESPTQQDARVPLEAEGRPPTRSKWNFNLDTPGALILLPVSSELEILKWLPSEEPATLPEALFRGMEKCIKRHRD